MNILHICVTSKWFILTTKLSITALDLPFCSHHQAKPIRFNVIYLFAIS